jgi:hypothetical protein
MMVAPASSIRIARSTISSQEDPFAIKSSIDNLRETREEIETEEWQREDNQSGE